MSNHVSRQGTAGSKGKGSAASATPGTKQAGSGVGGGKGSGGKTVRTGRGATQGLRRGQTGG